LLLEEAFCYFLTQKYEIRKTNAENKNKPIKYFGLRIPIPIHKCLNDLDFFLKVKITAPLWRAYSGSLRTRNLRTC
jgi:hypothetical protein